MSLLKLMPRTLCCDLVPSHTAVTGDSAINLRRLKVKQKNRKYIVKLKARMRSQKNNIKCIKSLIMVCPFKCYSCPLSQNQCYTTYSLSFYTGFLCMPSHLHTSCRDPCSILLCTVLCPGRQTYMDQTQVSLPPGIGEDWRVGGDWGWRVFSPTPSLTW